MPETQELGNTTGQILRIDLDLSEIKAGFEIRTALSQRRQRQQYSLERVALSNTEDPEGCPEGRLP